MMNAIVREMESRGYRAEIVTTIKNGVELTGISLTNGNDLMVPVFYKEFFWESLSASEVDLLLKLMAMQDILTELSKTCISYTLTSEMKSQIS